MSFGQNKSLAFKMPYMCVLTTATNKSQVLYSAWLHE
jgi:hypothetical protein